MRLNPSVHWHEGLFLQPHHLQHLQRRLHEQMQAIPPLLTPFPYGLIEARFSGDELAAQRVRFDVLRAVMPSGLVVCFPGNAELASISIAHPLSTAGERLTIYLAVPLWREAAGNTVEDAGADAWRQKRLWQVGETEVADENTGMNPQPLRVRRVSARLLCEGDDSSDMEVIPVLRITRDVAEDVGAPRADPAFIPPSLLVSASPQLQQMLRDVASLVNASRTALVEQNVLAELRKDTVRGPQLEQFLRLQCLSRFAARLNHCTQDAALTPFRFYCELRELLADLSPLRPELGVFEVASYDHDDPAPCFRELLRLLRQALQGQVVEAFAKVDFARQGSRFFVALKPEHFELPRAYYLAVRSRLDSHAVVELVEDADRFKLLPKSMQEAAIFGVKLTVDHAPPVELPSPGKGLLYFRLTPSERARLWAKCREERELVIDGPSEALSDFAISLYLLLPEPGAPK